MWKTAVRSKGFWFGVVVSCVGLAVALHGVRLDRLGAELASAPWGPVLALGLAMVLATGVRAYRWKVSIESFAPVAYKNVFSAFMAGMFGLNVIPARVGEYLRVFVLGKNSSLSQSAILATVVLERVVDGLTILTVFSAALILHPAPESRSVLANVRTEFLWIVPLIFLGCLWFLYAVSKNPARPVEVIRRICRPFGAAGAKLPGIVERFSGGLVIFADPARLARYLAWSFIAWMSIAFWYYLNFLAMGISLGMAEAVVLMSVVVVGVMIPAAPGFVGTYHAFCKGCLVAFGVDETVALTFAVITHLVPYVLHTFIGFVCVLRENVHWADLAARSPQAQ
ncbi:MAG: hypothetical protein A3G34_10320 [Candidatus Lindowbacteria bacterium RIFCSPLOWO2_12_FULL_62_27]|nr:MAG: hypothetical protein A3G34_10320 [Candidatus Lindowbacteria bacterium RIFCSPLOWO2_12_FULL_62_27]OGH63022.1 MAG: hypothetical protein A3I06_01575 [Candidatus Lindowbacteria bacterium RIFCSPLOWO2_02_FULL_62_12]